MVEQRLTELVESTARAFGAEAKVLYERIYPATVNPAAQARFAADVAAELVGEDNVVRNLAPSMGAEDFSFMLQKSSRAAMFAWGRAAALPTASCTTADMISTTP
jgi:metal-dependent amidase/aminoacylase/carboxypeptidase family protein